MLNHSTSTREKQPQSNPQSGFVVIIVLLLVAIVIAVVGLAGWRLHSRQKLTPVTPAKTQPAATPPKASHPAAVTVDFTAIGAVQTGDQVTATAYLPQNYGGVCVFGFYRAQRNVSKDVEITNSQECAVSIPVSEFPLGGLWSMHVIFEGDNNDNGVSAISSEKQLNITQN